MSKDGKFVNYEYVDSALVKNISWDLIKELRKDNIAPYEEFIKESYYSEKYLKTKYPTEEEYIKS